MRVLVLILILLIQNIAFSKNQDWKCKDLVSYRDSKIPISIEIEFNTFFFYYIINNKDITDIKNEKMAIYLSDRIYILEIRKAIIKDDEFLPMKKKF